MHTIQVIITMGIDGEYLQNAVTNVSCVDSNTREKLMHNLSYKKDIIAAGCVGALTGIIATTLQSNPIFDVDRYMKEFVGQIEEGLRAATAAEVVTIIETNAEKN